MNAAHEAAAANERRGRWCTCFRRRSRCGWFHLEVLHEEGDRVPPPRCYSGYVDVPA